MNKENQSTKYLGLLDTRPLEHHETTDDLFGKDDERTVAYYTERVEKFGNDVRTLNWGSKASQENRFAVLANIGSLNNKRVLDVGCGLGDFYGWLNNQHIETKFHGVDITPRLIEMARVRFPEATFEVGGLMQELHVNCEFDYVFASGIFYLRQDKPFKYMCKMITRMFELCRYGIAFNSLSEWAAEKDAGEFYADPNAVVEFCRSLSTCVVLRHDYHPSDFTIYLYKDNFTK
jgi:SAM-dependent methyltransferase